MRTLFFCLLLIALISVGYIIGNKHADPVRHNITTKKSEWESTILGSWKVTQVDSNSEESWLNEMDITFSKDHSFVLNGREKYFDHYRPDETYIKIAIGGGAEGTWSADDSILFLQFNKCFFQKSIIDPFATAKMHLSCLDNTGSLQFGTLSNFDLKSTVIKFTKEQIIITGRSYTENYDLRCQFDRQED